MASSLFYSCLVYLSIPSLRFKYSSQTTAILYVDPSKHPGLFLALGHVAVFGHEQCIFFGPKKKNTSGSARLGNKFNFDLISFIFVFFLISILRFNFNCFNFLQK